MNTLKDMQPAGPKAETLYIIWGAAVVVCIQTFALMAPIVLSFILIVLISLAVNPAISRIRRLIGGRKAATGIIISAMVLVVVITGLALFGPMKTSVAKLIDQLPHYWELLQKPLIKMENRAALFEQKLQTEVTTELAHGDAAAENMAPFLPDIEPKPIHNLKESGFIRSRINQLFTGVTGSFTAVAFNTAQMMVVLVTVFFGVTFTLMNPRPIVGAMFSLVPTRHHDHALIIAQRFEQFVRQWSLATLLGMLTIGVLVFILMLPIFGFADALVLGLIAGGLEAIPFIGPVLSAIPALLLAAGSGGMTITWVILAYIVVQILENNVIVPIIMTRKTKLHPVAVIFSILICVAAFGVLGVIIAAPMAAIVVILHDELYRKRYLPSVSDLDLDRLARLALHEKLITTK